MTQDAWITLCLRIGLIAGFTSLLAWVWTYTKITHGDAWRNPVGLTFIVKSLLIAGAFIPSTLSLFFHLSRLDSYIAGWADVVLIGAVAPVMLWRMIVFIRLDRLGRLPRNGKDGER